MQCAARVPSVLDRRVTMAPPVNAQAFSEVTVRMLKLAELGLSPAQVSLALMLVAIGVVTYYLLPLSFVLRDFALFLGILNAILLGMLLGLSLVSQTLQASFRQWWRRRAEGRGASGWRGSCSPWRCLVRGVVRSQVLRRGLCGPCCGERTRSWGP